MTSKADRNEVDVGAALRRLEVGNLPVDEGIRQRVRQRTLELFEAEATTTESLQDRDGSTDLARVLDENDGPEFNRRPLAHLVLAAAAVILLAVLGLSNIGPKGEGRVDAGPDGSTSARPAGAILGNQELPQLLQPGSYEASALGTTIAFTLDRPVWVISEDPGLIELSIDPDDPQANRLAFVRPTGLSRALANVPAESEGLVDWLNSSPDGLAVQSSAGRVGGDQVEGRWAVFLADSLVREQECSAGRVCIPLFEEPEGIGFYSGGNNTVLQLSQDDLDPIIVVVWSPPSEGRTSYGAFASMIGTLEIGEAEPNPLRDQ